MMLRGTKVRVTNKAKLKHLRGKVGITSERVKRSGYIQIIIPYEGYLISICFPEEELDIIEPPVEL